MYLISKVIEDYEGTWSNALMYENNLDKAKEISKELQDAMISLRKKYIQIKEGINFILNVKYPNYHNDDINLTIDEQIKSIDENDTENYFEKEERLLKNARDKELNEREKFLYDINYMNGSYKLVYFTVKKILCSDEVLSKPIDKDEFWNLEYSTRELAEKQKFVFDVYIN